MKIWLISHFEQTPVDKAKSARFQTLADFAADRGHDVTFFTSTFKHNTKTQRFNSTTRVQIRDNYANIFVKSDSYKNNISIKRFIAHKRFAKQLMDELEENSKPDAILMAFPPIEMIYSVSEWAHRHKIPYVVDIIDPWPDVFKNKLDFIPEKISNTILTPMYKKVRYILKNAHAVTAISQQYIDWAENLQPDIEGGYCFYPSRKFDEMQEDLRLASTTLKRDEDRLTVIYAGSFGMFYDISTILNAATILNDKYGDNIRFIIAGDGTQKEKVQEYDIKYSNIEYVGRVPKEVLMKYYYLADLGLIQHISGATQSVTYKLFDLLACGLPILNSLESEMKSIINDNSVGLFNKPGDSKQLAKNIEKFYLDREFLSHYKNNAINLTKQKGDARVVYNKFIDIIEELV